MVTSLSASKVYNNSTNDCKKQFRNNHNFSLIEDITKLLNIKYWEESDVIIPEDYFDKIIQKFKNHPSIAEIKKKS